MKNYIKHYNNLMDSILFTLFLGLEIIFLVIPIALACNGHIDTNADPKTVIIAITALFGSMSIMTLFLIIRYCYGYYVIYDDKLLYHNLYSKKIVAYKDIKKIEIKEEWVFTYKTDVLSIYGEKSVIKIYICPKNKEEILK